MKSRSAIQDARDLDIVSAIWILACNDENPSITYESIRSRLGLAPEVDIKGLVGTRAELFRHGIPSERLRRWKQEMSAGKHLPAWLREVDDEAKKTAAIDALSADDVFRSQFRAEADAPRSPIEIIDWGIKHIDRLRKAGVEAREEKFKWVTGLTLPLLSMIVAFTAILSNSCSERRRSNNEIESSKYETTFRIKHEAYISFMKALADAYDHAYRSEIPAVIQRPALLQSIDRLETAYYSLEPFLDKRKQSEVWNRYQDFASMCIELQKSPASPDREKDMEQFLALRLYFRTELYEALSQNRRAIYPGRFISMPSVREQVTGFTP